MKTSRLALFLLALPSWVVFLSAEKQSLIFYEQLAPASPVSRSAKLDLLRVLTEKRIGEWPSQAQTTGEVLDRDKSLERIRWIHQAAQNLADEHPELFDSFFISVAEPILRLGSAREINLFLAVNGAPFERLAKKTLFYDRFLKVDIERATEWKTQWNNVSGYFYLDDRPVVVDGSKVSPAAKETFMSAVKLLNDSGWAAAHGGLSPDMRLIRLQHSEEADFAGKVHPEAKPNEILLNVGLSAPMTAGTLVHENQHLRHHTHPRNKEIEDLLLDQAAEGLDPVEIKHPWFSSPRPPLDLLDELQAYGAAIQFYFFLMDGHHANLGEDLTLIAYLYLVLNEAKLAFSQLQDNIDILYDVGKAWLDEMRNEWSTHASRIEALWRNDVFQAKLLTSVEEDLSAGEAARRIKGFFRAYNFSKIHPPGEKRDSYARLLVSAIGKEENPGVLARLKELNLGPRVNRTVEARHRKFSTTPAVFPAPKKAAFADDSIEFSL